MDLDYPCRRHRVSLFIADNSASRQARQVHSELADRHASRIADAAAV